MPPFKLLKLKIQFYKFHFITYQNMFLIKLFLFLSNSHASSIDYQFYQSFGQIFMDSTSNSNYAVNGASSTSTIYDTIPTDRGAYFPSTPSYILLPPNDQVSSPFSFSSTFTIYLWILPVDTSDYYIFYRGCPTCSNYFYIVRMQSNGKLKIRLVYGSYDSGVQLTSCTLATCNTHIATWSLVFLNINPWTGSVGISQSTCASLSLSFGSYLEGTGDYYGYIGGITDSNFNSMNGFMWRFAYSDLIPNFGNYLGGYYTPGTCLYGQCSPYCNPAFLYNGGEVCLSININPAQDSAGTACPACTNGCLGSMCLDCTCTSLSCGISAGSIVCETISTGAVICSSGFVLVGVTCTACYSECATCTSTTLCSTCVAADASPATSTGCVCNQGFYGTSPLTSPASCTPCYQECSACTDSSLCTSCLSLHASPSPLQGCSCSPGYSGASPLLSVDSCIATSSVCNAECSTCDISTLNCIVCVAMNAVPAGASCLCSEGFFGAGPLTSEDSCQACSADCSICEASGCIDCLALHASPSSGGCECTPGYYGNSPLTETNSCSACEGDCFSCTGPGLCGVCKDPNAVPSMVQGCQCKDGYFVGGEGTCQACGDPCSTCTDAEACTGCRDTGANLDELGNCYCPQTAQLSGGECVCGATYYMGLGSSGGNECLRCAHPCDMCVNKEICSSCQGLLQVDDKGKCTICQNGYYYENFDCFPCRELCSVCTSYEKCMTCVEHSYNTALCTCGEGFSQSGSACNRNYFFASLQVLPNNSIDLSFTEPLSTALSLSDLKLAILNTTFSISLHLNTPSLYTLAISLYNSVKANTELSLKILRSLNSTTASELKNFALVGYLHEYTVPFTNKYLAGIANATTTATQILVSTAAISALVSNPSNLWILLGTIQIISYIPLSNTPLPMDLRNFLLGMGNLNLIKNPMTLMFTGNIPGETYLEASEYGFSNSLFVYNAGTYILSFLGFVAIIPCIYLLSKITHGYLGVQCEKILKNYKYSFFLRFWLQGYLDLGVFAIVEIKSFMIYWDISPDFWQVLSSTISAFCFVRVT